MTEEAPGTSSGGGTPVALDQSVFDRVSALCLGLPEVTVRVDTPRTSARSTSYSFEIRRRSFCLLIAVAGADAEPIPQLVLRADPTDSDALQSRGHPFRSSRAGPDRIRVLLACDTDWTEIRALVTESYRILAPKKLIARLDGERA